MSEEKNLEEIKKFWPKEFPKEFPDISLSYYLIGSAIIKFLENLGIKINKYL